MSEVVKVSTVETSETLMRSIEEYFEKGRYAQITQLIGMHSILIDPQHAREDQSRLYRSVLDMVKNRIAGNLGERYSTWYANFPIIMEGFINNGHIVMDNAFRNILASRQAAYGPFKSADQFFFWGLEDRRMNLEQIVKYLEKTAELDGK